MIDWERVSELRGEIGDEDFAEVVEIFLDEVEEEMTKLDNETSSEDLQSIFHFLKGSAVNLGFSAFSKLCGQAETTAKAGENAEIHALKVSYDRSKSEFLSALTKLDAA